MVHGAEINGNVNDEKTRDTLKYLADNGITVDMMMQITHDQWKPEPSDITEDADKNGKLSTDTFVNLCGEEYLEVHAATAWAMMVQGVESHNKNTNDPKQKLKISSFYVDTGYRSYKDQIRMEAYERYGEGNTAANPDFKDETAAYNYMKANYKATKNGTIPDEVYTDGVLKGNGKSNHGWGIAVDLDPHDRGGKEGQSLNKDGEHVYGTGVATTNDVKWLQENACHYGYYGLYKSDTKPYFKETWHWNYKGERMYKGDSRWVEPSADSQ